MHYLLSNSNSPLKYIHSGKLVSQNNFLHTRRNIDTFVLLLVCTGTLYMNQDDQNYELTANSYFLLLPDHEHYGYQKSEGALTYYWCHFQISDVGYKLLSSAQLAQCDPMKHYIIPEFGILASADRTSLIFRQILDLAQMDDHSTDMNNYALSLLAMEITRDFAEHEKIGCDKETKVHYVITEIKEWIYLNYNNDLSLKQIADEFHYNKDYLSCVFKQYTGYSLLQYIHKIRISMAKQHLLNTSDSISKIAVESGFHDEKHFMKLFKKLENVTPTQYRNAFYRKHLVK